MTPLSEVTEVVAAHADEAEEHRCIPEESLRALREAGMFRLLLPRELGGTEAPMREVLETAAAVAAADGSTGWCACISMGSKVFGALLPEAAAREVYGDPDAGAAGVFAATGTVRDGRLTGRWPFASNCLHAAWIGMGAFVEGNPVPRLFFLPADRVTVHETWDSSGLRATGSHDISVDDVPVDLDFSCTFVDRPWTAGALWRMPVFTVLGPALVAVPVGIARGALDKLLGEGMTEDPVHLAELAAAEAALRAAFDSLVATAERIEALAADGVRADRQAQARSFLTVQHAADTAVAVTSTCHRIGGGRAAYSSSGLLRCLRDVHAARQHMMFSHAHRPHVMRILNGADEMLPPIVV